MHSLREDIAVSAASDHGALRRSSGDVQRTEAGADELVRQTGLQHSSADRAGLFWLVERRDLRCARLTREPTGVGHWRSRTGPGDVSEADLRLARPTQAQT